MTGYSSKRRESRASSQRQSTKVALASNRPSASSSASSGSHSSPDLTGWFELQGQIGAGEGHPFGFRCVGIDLVCAHGRSWIVDARPYTDPRRADTLRARSKYQRPPKAAASRTSIDNINDLIVFNKRANATVEQRKDRFLRNRMSLDRFLIRLRRSHHIRNECDHRETRSHFLSGR